MVTISNSNLVTYTKISNNKNSPRNATIDTITIHCMVGQMTGQSCADWFSNSSCSASSNYCIGYDGSVAMSVEEKDRSWCTSSSSNDNRAITIEVASEKVAPYTVTDKAYAKLIDLCVDICQRNNIKELKWLGDNSLIGNVDKQNMTVHRWFANKECPGDYLYNLHGDIANQVNARLGVTTTTTATSTSEYQVRVVDTDPNGLNVRDDASFNSKVVTTIKDGGIYTIVEDKTINGFTFGRLKSGSGWIVIKDGLAVKV